MKKSRQKSYSSNARVNRWSKLRSLLAVILVSSLIQMAEAQDFEPSTASPYNTIYTHLLYLQPDSYQPELAAFAIDPTSVKDSTERIKRAIQLKQILDGEGLFVNLEKLPKQAGFVDSVSKKEEYTLFPQDRPEIYLIKKGQDWYYAPQTIKLIPALHKKVFPFGSTFLMNMFPAFGHKTFLGLALWQYIGIIFIFIFCLVLFWISIRLFRPFIRKLLSRWLFEESSVQIKHIDLLASGISLLLILQVACYMFPMLLLPIKFAAWVSKIIRIGQIIVFALVLVRAANFFIFHLQSFVGRTTSKMDDQLLPLLKKIVHLIIIAGAILQVLSLLNVNVTALIAGVSIGGLAIALAAQDAVKNFIGSIMIFADRPFQIGDYIIGSGFEGEVAEVGFRTTRIKSLDTSIIAVPNGSLANMNIQNLGVRSKRIFNTTLNMTYDAEPAQLQAYVADLKQLIIDHEALSNQNFYVHVKEMAESSINIMFRAYLEVPGYADELKTKEEIIYEMMKLAKKHKLSFAFPSRTVYNRNE